MRRLTLCVAVAVLAVALAAEAKTIRVPADHKTIQAAVDAAESGDTVLVSAGTYAEHVKLREGVYLKSAGDDSPGDHTYEGRKPLKRAEQTIIDVKGSTKGAVVAGAEGATLDGFTITGLGHVNHHLPNHAHAVECRNCSATIIHCIIRDNGSTGIGQHAKKGATLGLVAAPYVADNFVFRNKGIGIGNNHRSQTVVVNNVVLDNCEAGIGARNEAAPLIEGNLVARNGFGYDKLDPAECKKFDKNPLSRWPGIGVKDGARALIRNNRSIGNAVIGIGVDNGAFALIEGNTVTGNDYPGIGVGGHKAAEAVIRGNVVRGNRGPGIGINIGSRAVVTGNTVGKNGEGMPGIAVAGHSTATVVGNTIEAGCIAGIAVIGSTATVSGNTVTGATKAGIRVDDSVATIDGNTVVEAGTAGLYLHDSRVTATRNTVRACTHNGIVVIGQACRANVSANVLDGNGKDGGAHIYLDPKSASRLAANTFRNAGRLGDVYRGQSKYGMPFAAAEPAMKMKQFRAHAAILGPGPTENFFKTGKDDHTHGPGDQGHDH